MGNHMPFAKGKAAPPVIQKVARADKYINRT